MTEYTSLDELFRQSVTFPGPNTLLAGLQTALEVVEEELLHACEKATIRLYDRHKRETKHLHPDDIALDLYDLELTVKLLLPRIFRSGFVLNLWTVFEVVAKQMAEYVCRERGLPKPKFQGKNKTFLDILDDVYTKKLHILAFPDATVRNQLDQLRQVRNALVHHNGNVNALRFDRKDFKAMKIESYNELDEDVFVLTGDFLNCNLALVHSYLVSLSERVYKAVHPIPLRDADI